MKYEVGDIVKVREDLRAGKDFGNLCVCYPMVKFAGKLVTISSVNNDNDYHIEEDDSEYYWIDEFFEDEDEEYNVDKIIKEEEKSDEYDDIIDRVLSEMTEENKDKLIKYLVNGYNITIEAVPVYKIVCRTNGVSINQIVGTKYSVTIITENGTVVL